MIWRLRNYCSKNRIIDWVVLYFATYIDNLASFQGRQTAFWRPDKRVEMGMEGILFPTYSVSVSLPTWQPLSTQAELNGNMSRRTQKPITWRDEEPIGLSGHQESQRCSWWSTRKWWEWRSDGVDVPPGCRGAQKTCLMLVISTKEPCNNETLVMECWE